MGELIERTRRSWLNKADVLRKEAKLCDVVLYVQGRLGAMVGYPAHKLVLINASRYFEGLFERDNLGSHYHFPSLTEEGLFTLLNIIYGHDISGEIKIEDALYAAKYLQVESAVQFLEHKLTEQIHIKSSPQTHIRSEFVARGRVPTAQGRPSPLGPKPVRLVHVDSGRTVDRTTPQASPRQRYSDSHSPHSAVSHSPMSEPYSTTPTYPPQVSLPGIEDNKFVLQELVDSEGNPAVPTDNPTASDGQLHIIKVESEDEDYDQQDDGDNLTEQYSQQELAMMSANADMDSGHSYDSSGPPKQEMMQGFGQLDDGSGDANQMQGLMTIDDGQGTVDGSGMRLCRVCGAQFNTAVELSDHLRTHRQAGLLLQTDPASSDDTLADILSALQCLGTDLSTVIDRLTRMESQSHLCQNSTRQQPSEPSTSSISPSSKTPEPLTAQTPPMMPRPSALLSANFLDIKKKECLTPTHFATQLARRLFSKQELLECNCAGIGRKAFDKDKLDLIKTKVFTCFLKPASEQHIIWRNCRKAIDSMARYVRGHHARCSDSQ